MLYRLIVMCLLLCSLTPAAAQVNVNFALPGVHIGINLPVYPQLQRVPGYPVYYAPSVNSNYFFYDGLYWVYERDNWYESAWYNGPWRIVDPLYVPLYVLRVPVRYYRRAPVYFHGWHANESPRWGDHWGRTWTQRRSGWDQWNRHSSPAPAPLPGYQQHYSGNRYPHTSQQAVIQTQNYRFQPSDSIAQQHFQHQRVHAQSVQTTQTVTPPPRQAPSQRPQTPQQTSPQQTGQPQQTPGTRDPQAPKPPPQRTDRHSQPASAAREQPTPRPQTPESRPSGKEQNQGQNRGKESKDHKEKDPKDKGQER